MKTFTCTICGKEKPWRYCQENKYCSKVCYRHGEYLENIRKWKDGGVTGNKGVRSIQLANYVRRYIEEKYNHKCAQCGQGTTWQGKPLTLQVEHLDGNSSNSKEENLSLLCPNCHTQTQYYGSKNKGKGRGSLLKEMRK